MLARLKAFLRVHLNPATFLILAKIYRWIVLQLRRFIALRFYFAQRISYILRTLFDRAKNDTTHAPLRLNVHLVKFLRRHMKPGHFCLLSRVYKRIAGKIRWPALFILFPLIYCLKIIISVIRATVRMIIGGSNRTSFKAQKEIEFYLKYHAVDLSSEVRLLMPIISRQTFALKKSEAK